jgi:hypothetical protein
MALTSHKATQTIPVLDPLPVVLELMEALATSVLNEHIDETGLRVVCGSAWPCERVVLPEHNLAVI